MVKLKGVKPEKNKKLSLSKPLIIFSIILMLIPLVFIFYSNTNINQIKIGIVLTSGDTKLLFDAETARDGLNDFEGIFKSEILDLMFNESQVRIKDGYYLTNDYFISEFAKNVRHKFDVDIIMIMTNKTINDWLDDGMAYWGKANTKLTMTLVSTAPFQNNYSVHANYIKKTSIHEALHIVGYEHPKDGRECIMQYGRNSGDLSDEYRIELPYKLSLWKLGRGLEFGRATFVIKLVESLFFSTFFLGLIILTQHIFNAYIYKEIKIDKKPLIFGIGILYISVLFTSAFFYSLYLRIMIFISSIFIYIIIESIYFDVKERKQKKINNDKTED